MPTDHTETQPAPNLSTEHRREGDARRPSDTLDRAQTGDSDRTQPRPDLSTEPSDRPEDPRHTPGGLDQEAVEDRPNVGSVEPEDYPAADRERRN